MMGGNLYPSYLGTGILLTADQGIGINTGHENVFPSDGPVFVLDTGGIE